MPTNIEIKARAANWAGQLAEARRMADGAEELFQKDTFFNCANGRLKLRDLGPGGASNLIFYQRADQTGPKASDYATAPVSDAVLMRSLLAGAFGEGKTIEKKRIVILVGQTRIHFDEVKGLGQFIELEVCLRPGQDKNEGEAVAQDLMRRLGIEKSMLLEGAYVDLLR